MWLRSNPSVCKVPFVRQIQAKFTLRFTSISDTQSSFFFRSVGISQRGLASTSSSSLAICSASSFLGQKAFQYNSCSKEDSEQLWHRRLSERIDTELEALLHLPQQRKANSKSSNSLPTTLLSEACEKGLSLSLGAPQRKSMLFLFPRAGTCFLAMLSLWQFVEAELMPQLAHVPRRSQTSIQHIQRSNEVYSHPVLQALIPGALPISHAEHPLGKWGWQWWHDARRCKK